MLVVALHLTPFVYLLLAPLLSCNGRDLSFMALPVHVSIFSSWQAMLFSTLIFSFAPKLICSQSSAPPSQSKDPSCNGRSRNDSSCPPPTGTAKATTLKTQISTSASRVNTSSTTKPLPPLETRRSREGSEPTPTPIGQHSPTPTTGAGIGIGIGLGTLILIALALAILWFRRRQNHNQKKPTMDGLGCEPKPSFEEESAKSPRVQSDVISSQDLSCLAYGRNISPETHNLPLCGPRLTALNTTIPHDLKSSSASKLITNSISSPGLVGDADAAFRYLDQSVPMAVPGTLVNEARSPVSPEEHPIVFFPNVPPSSEEKFPPNPSQAHSSIDLDPPPLAAKRSHEFSPPISQQEWKDASSPSASSFIILDSPQSLTPEVRSGGARAHLRDNPQPLRSNSSASRGTLADPPNHRETSIANNTPGSNSTAVGPTTTVKDSLDSKNGSAATIQNFSRKIGSLTHASRQGRDSGG